MPTGVRGAVLCRGRRALSLQLLVRQLPLLSQLHVFQQRLLVFVLEPLLLVLTLLLKHRSLLLIPQSNNIHGHIRTNIRGRSKRQTPHIISLGKWDLDVNSIR